MKRCIKKGKQRGTGEGTGGGWKRKEGIKEAYVAVLTRNTDEVPQ